MFVQTKTIPLSISSSDSDSESEPEYVATKSRLHQRKRKKVKGQKSEAKQVGEVIAVTDLLGNQVFVADKTSLTNIDSVNVALHIILNPRVNSWFRFPF